MIYRLLSYLFLFMCIVLITITVVFIVDESRTDANADWFWHISQTEHVYNKLIGEGWQPQQARSVLPNSLKTEIVCTFNLREWRHFFKLRTSKAAHPQMREIACPLLEKFKELIPVIFDGIDEG